MSVTTFGIQILGKNPGCLFKGCCVLIENDSLHCLNCLRTWINANWHPQTGRREFYWSRDVADLSLERISSTDNRTAEVLQRAAPGEVVGRMVTLCDSRCAARCGSAELGCHFTHTCARPHVQRQHRNTRWTCYNIPSQPERCFTHRMFTVMPQINEDRAAKMSKIADTGDLRALTWTGGRQKNPPLTFSHFGLWVTPTVQLLNLRWSGWSWQGVTDALSPLHLDNIVCMGFSREKLFLCFQSCLTTFNDRSVLSIQRLNLFAMLGFSS